MSVPSFDYDVHFEAYQTPISVRLTLPLSPSVNQAYTSNRNGRGLRATDALKNYKNSIAMLLRGNLDRLDNPESPYCFAKGTLLDAYICICANGASDIDNRKKALFDALELADVYDDDKCIRWSMTEITQPGTHVPYHVGIELVVSRHQKRQKIESWWING